MPEAKLSDRMMEQVRHPYGPSGYAMFRSEVAEEVAALEAQVARLREFGTWLDAEYETKRRVDFYLIREKWCSILEALDE